MQPISKASEILSILFNYKQPAISRYFYNYIELFILPYFGIFW